MSGRIRAHRKALIAGVAGVLAVAAGSAWFLVHRGPDTMPTATCGEIVTQHGSSGVRFYEQDAGALKCFRQDAVSCHSGSLLVVEAGADAGTRSVVALHRTGSACTAHVTEQAYNNDWKSPIHHFDCAQVLVGDSGETVACGAGTTFSVPLSAG